MSEDSNSTIIYIEELELCKKSLQVVDPKSLMSKITKNKVYHSSIDSDLKSNCRPAFNTFIKAYAKHYLILCHQTLFGS